jgi:hypothetical protein
MQMNLTRYRFRKNGHIVGKSQMCPTTIKPKGSKLSTVTLASTNFPRFGIFDLSLSDSKMHRHQLVCLADYVEFWFFY